MHFLIFAGFFVAVLQSVKPESSNEWNVERSSVNPLSYTEEDRYPREWTTDNPLLTFYRRRTNCPTNEHFSLCDANCQQNCDNYNKLRPCSRSCIWGCICNLGLVRGPNKQCIKSEECPKKQHADSQHVDSIPELTTENSQFEKTENLPYWERENRPASQSNKWSPVFPIPLICRKNEVLDPCPSTCQDDCNNFRKKDRKCNRFCIPSCVCESGFVRNHKGECIKPYECHQEKNFCPTGEEYSPCNSHCEGNCLQGKVPINNCKNFGWLCVSGCTCKAGLVRGPDGTCIYPTECPTTPPKEPPTKVCPENELYDECKALCQRNCTNYDSALPCPRICQPGCVCKDPMIRGKYGKCVESDECTRDESSADIYVTLNPPPYTDEDYLIPESVTEMQPVSYEENQLVLKTESPQFEQGEILKMFQPKLSDKCPPLEKWVVCGSHCQRTCSNKDDKVVDCRPVCISGCICEEGLVRGPDGTCIEKDKCPSESSPDRNAFSSFPPLICGSNEFLDPCPSNCTDDCNNYKDTNRICRKVCVPKCTCYKGFVRGPKGQCIDPSKCPDKKDSCRPDEMFSLCHGNCEKNCSNWAFDLVCPKKCIAGCVCRPGRVRGRDNKCVLWSDCLRPEKDSFRHAENNRLNLSPDAKCPNDKECTISCRHYGHSYGHCTGLNNLICSCYIEPNENADYY